MISHNPGGLLTIPAKHMAKTLDAKEVARHNTASCCWLIVYKKVWRHRRDPHLRRARRDNRVDRPSAPTRGVRRASLASRMHGAWTSRRWPPPGPSCWRARLGGEGVLSDKPRAYYRSVGDDLATKTANNPAYHSVSLRPRVFVDVRDVDTTSAICREGISLPVFWALTRVARRVCF